MHTHPRYLVINDEHAHTWENNVYYVSKNIRSNHNNDYEGNPLVLSTTWKKSNIDSSLPCMIISVCVEGRLIQNIAPIVYFILKLELIKIMSSLQEIPTLNLKKKQHKDNI